MVMVYQTCVHLLLVAHAAANYAIQVWGYSRPATGLDLLNLGTGAGAWAATAVLTQLERGWQLPISARHGHGPVLLIFWTLAFIQVTADFCLGKSGGGGGGGGEHF